MTHDVVFIGAGRQAMVLAEIVLADTDARLLGFLDAAPASSLPDFVRHAGAAILGDDDALAGYAESALLHVAIGAKHAAARRAIIEACDKRGARLHRIIHPRAIISPSAAIGDGSAVMAGAAVQTHALIGRHCCINTGATVDHDCRIADNVFIQPGAHLGGDVSVGEGSVIGIGAAVRDGVSIGRNCFIGGGAFVADDIEDNTLAYGVPAKPAGTKD